MYFEVLMKDFSQNLFNRLNLLESKIQFMEEKILQMEENHEKKVSLLKSYILKIKNNEFISNANINSQVDYNDLSPEKAHEIYSSPISNIILLDVSESKHDFKISHSTKIPLSQLERFLDKKENKNKNIFVISESGTDSILACESLIEHGFYNVSNISGGHQCWPGHKQERQAS